VRARLAEQGIGKYIVIAPGASWRAKCWPAERYGEVCRELERRHAPRAIIVHGPGEKSLAETVQLAAAPAKPMVMTTTLEELMALLAGALCVIAADSGPLHLATALGTPVVGLYGPTDPARNGPFGPHVAIETQARPEEISYKRLHEYAPAMLRITVEHVLANCDRCIGITA
jgi:heptosyltransferase-1